MTNQLADMDWLYRRYITERRSSTAISRELGCVPSTVLRALRRHRIPVRDGATRPVLDGTSAADILRMARLHPSMLSMSQEMGISRAALVQHIERIGLSTDDVIAVLGRQQSGRAAKRASREQRAAARARERAALVSHVMSMRQSGATLKEIGAAVGLSTSRVCRIVQAAGDGLQS